MDDVICATRLPLCRMFGMYVYCNAPEIWVFVTSHTRRSGQCICTSCKHSDIGTPQKKEFYLCAANTPVAARAWVATLRWPNCSFLLLLASNNCELLDCHRCTHIISRYFTWIHMTFGQVLFFQESVLNSKVPSATSNLDRCMYGLTDCCRAAPSVLKAHHDYIP